MFNEYCVSILHYYCYSIIRMRDSIKIHVSLGLLVHLPVQAKCYKIEWKFFAAAEYKKLINTVVTSITAFVTRHGLNGTCIERIWQWSRPTWVRESSSHLSRLTVHWQPFTIGYIWCLLDITKWQSRQFSTSYTLSYVIVAKFILISGYYCILILK